MTDGVNGYVGDEQPVDPIWNGCFIQIDGQKDANNYKRIERERERDLLAKILKDKDQFHVGHLLPRMWAELPTNQ